MNAFLRAARSDTRCDILLGTCIFKLKLYSERILQLEEVIKIRKISVNSDKKFSKHFKMKKI